MLGHCSGSSPVPRAVCSVFGVLAPFNFPRVGLLFYMLLWDLLVIELSWSPWCLCFPWRPASRSDPCRLLRDLFECWVLGSPGSPLGVSDLALSVWGLRFRGYP